MNASGTDARAMVIGYGNPLRGDDGVGWAVIQHLAQTLDPATVATMAVHLLTPELADPISRMDLVIFIDAAEGRPGGQITQITVEPADGALTPMTHHLTPQRLLALAEQMFGRRPRALLFTIAGVDFGHSEGLSGPVARACRTLVADVERIVAQPLHSA